LRPEGENIYIWERGMNCEEEMRVKNEMDEVWYMDSGEKRKEKRKKKLGGEGRGKVRKVRKEKMETKKLNWYYLFVQFV
jgi:hypothetical protein